MSTITPVLTTKPIHYPESDGQPMADNTQQFDWITLIKFNLDALFAERADVVVFGDLLWYPLEGFDKLRVAPDVMVVFGRPQGERGSYLQWQEAQIAPQVVFEILSPGNRLSEMAKKLDFYRRYGVEEYYLYDPDRNDLSGWLRTGDQLEALDEMDGWVSPRLDIRFELTGDTLKLYYPDGRPFQTFLDVTLRAERLAAQLRALGVEPEA